MTAADNPVLASCRCGDDVELQLLRDLILRGVNQWDASLIAFGHPPRITATNEVHTIWIRLEVRRLGNLHRSELGMPELPLTLEHVYPMPVQVKATLVAATERASRALKRLGAAMRRTSDQLILAGGR